MLTSHSWVNDGAVGGSYHPSSSNTFKNTTGDFNPEVGGGYGYYARETVNLNDLNLDSVMIGIITGPADAGYGPGGEMGFAPASSDPSAYSSRFLLYTEECD